MLINQLGVQVTISPLKRFLNFVSRTERTEKVFKTLGIRAISEMAQLEAQLENGVAKKKNCIAQVMLITPVFFIKQIRI